MPVLRQCYGNTDEDARLHPLCVCFAVISGCNDHDNNSMEVNAFR